MSNRRNTSPRRRKPWQPYLRLPAFLPVPLRARRDGWTPERQGRFIGLLAQTGCVRTAAQTLGLSRESAYRLRRHSDAGSFTAAWNTALKGRTQPRWKFTLADRVPLAFGQLLQPRMWRRRLVAVQRNPAIPRFSRWWPVSTGRPPAATWTRSPTGRRGHFSAVSCELRWLSASLTHNRRPGLDPGSRSLTLRPKNKRDPGSSPGRRGGGWGTLARSHVH
jgi:hypothetical protein